MAQGAVIQAAASKWKRYNFHSLPGVESEDEVLDEDEEGESTPFQKKVGVLLNSVSGLHVTLISSESRVYQLKHSAQVGLSATQSVGLLKWTVLIGQTGFDTIPSIPDPTLSFRRTCLPTLNRRPESTPLYAHSHPPFRQAMRARPISVEWLL
jgi:hypothetical protein